MRVLEIVAYLPAHLGHVAKRVGLHEVDPVIELSGVDRLRIEAIQVQRRRHEILHFRVIEACTAQCRSYLTATLTVVGVRFQTRCELHVGITNRDQLVAGAERAPVVVGNSVDA